MPRRKPIDDDDNPEWTEEDLKRARRAREVLPANFLDEMAAIRKARLAARKRRGQQKAPTKIQVTLRIDSDVISHFREQGRGWQTRINEVLKIAATSKHARAR